MQRDRETPSEDECYRHRSNVRLENERNYSRFLGNQKRVSKFEIINGSLLTRNLSNESLKQSEWEKRNEFEYSDYIHPIMPHDILSQLIIESLRSALHASKQEQGSITACHISDKNEETPKTRATFRNRACVEREGIISNCMLQLGKHYGKTT